jgi:AcrR family transcriptional regulator
MRIDRREAIADAAITVIARDGVRALTHRALDRELDLPPGSTSYYLRTRRDLLAATVDRLAQRTVADLLEPAERQTVPPDSSLSESSSQSVSPLLSQPDPVEQVSGAMALLLVNSMESRSDDHRARFALAAELVGDPELHAMVTSRSPIRARLLADAVRALGALGVADPESRAPALVALADGILHDRLVGSRVAAEETRAQRLDDVRRTFADYLRGAARAPQGPRLT